MSLKTLEQIARKIQKEIQKDFAGRSGMDLDVDASVLKEIREDQVTLICDILSSEEQLWAAFKCRNCSMSAEKQ